MLKDELESQGAEDEQTHRTERLAALVEEQS